MKNLILVAAIMLFGTVGFAQLKVAAPNGDVKIGNTAVLPVEKLDVDGNGRFTGGSIFLGSDSGFEFIRTGVSQSSRFFHSGAGQFQFTALDNASISFSTNNVARMLVTRNQGNLVVLTGQALKPGGGTWAVFSDRRLKEDINPYQDGLNEILRIKPVTFKYNKEVMENNEKEYVGVIAQDIQKIAPYMTNSADLFNSEADVKSSDYLSVDPNAFTYMLINAVQEQQEIIDEQNDMIRKLSERMDALENGSTQTNNPSISQDVEISDPSFAELGQNQPNPFTNETIIKYSIPENSRSAAIVVTNQNGQVIKNISLDTNSNQIVLKALGLSSGTYNYSILIDGVLIQSKKMVLQK